MLSNSFGLQANAKNYISINSLDDLSKIENIAIEGSCDGSMACSTCHVIIHKDWLTKIPAPCIDEKEMLSLLPNFTKNSRLGCQIVITEKLEGLQFSLPRST